MVIDSVGMKKMEADSGLSPDILLHTAGQNAAALIAGDLKDTKEKKILVLCGKGNNGGDGFVIAKDLHAKVCEVENEIRSAEAKNAYAELNRDQLIESSSLDCAVEEADVIIDCIYGYSYHGSLSPDMRKLFQKINASDAFIYSIDINSGAEADTGRYDPDAIVSDVTIAVDCLKPFHLLRKEHHLFKEVRTVSLGIPHPAESSWYTMDEERFFQQFPRRRDNAYKGTYGGCTLIGGSYGMAGALCLNILGARTIGASYIHAACPQEIYAIAANRFLTPVFHPFAENNVYDVLEPLLINARAVSFGSGCTNMPKKKEILDLILQTAECPVVLDAEAIRLLIHDYYVLRFIKEPVILTPHIGEFSALINKPVNYIRDNLIPCVRDFAKDYRVIVVLKGANTIAASPTGEIYINETGCQALAQAGSGDLLTGMITACLTQAPDVFEAVCMAVWLHGKLAEDGAREHAMQNFDLSQYPALADAFFHSHNY